MLPLKNVNLQNCELFSDPDFDGEPVQNAFTTMADIPPSTPLSVQMSKDLKKMGFKFVGPTICYAFMQSIGMVNDHIVSCFRYEEVRAYGQY